MTRVVLDASALLALILGETGGDAVGEVLADAVMTTVNLAEVVTYAARNGATESDVRALLDPLPFERVAFDEDLAHAAGLLVARTRSAGLSLGDRACLSLAARLGVPAMTADRPWEVVGRDTGIAITLIR